MTPTRRTLLWTVGTVVVAAFLVALYRPGYERRSRMESALAAAEAEHQRLEAEYARVSARVAGLATDPLALEREARHQLGLVRRGEVIYKFPQEPRP